MIQRVVYINYVISLLSKHVVDVYEALFETQKNSSISAVDNFIDFLKDLKKDLRES
tara:strand:+ start:11521 stop:11688 length:168 start_codon:yes stop_codon:yes gene_type:complete